VKFGRNGAHRRRMAETRMKTGFRGEKSNEYSEGKDFLECLSMVSMSISPKYILSIQL
jgi:hypothetical protein